MLHIEKILAGIWPLKHIRTQTKSTIDANDTSNVSDIVNKTQSTNVIQSKEIQTTNKTIMPNWFKMRLPGKKNKKLGSDETMVAAQEPKIKQSASLETKCVRGDSQRFTPPSIKNVVKPPSIAKDKSTGSSMTFTARIAWLGTPTSSKTSIREGREVPTDRKRMFHNSEAQSVKIQSIQEIREIRRQREASAIFNRSLVSSLPNLSRKTDNTDDKHTKNDKKSHKKWGSLSENLEHKKTVKSREVSAKEQFEFIERKRSLTTHVAVTRIFTKTYQRNIARSAAGEVITSEEKVNQYHLYNTIGTGAFGRVVLARDDVNDESFACKIISKKRLLKKLRFLPIETSERLEIIKAEIAILKKVSHHPNIITLVEVLESSTDEHLYMCIILLISL